MIRILIAQSNNKGKKFIALGGDNRDTFFEDIMNITNDTETDVFHLSGNKLKKMSLVESDVLNMILK